MEYIEDSPLRREIQHEMVEDQAPVFQKEVPLPASKGARRISTSLLTIYLETSQVLHALRDPQVRFTEEERRLALIQLMPLAAFRPTIVEECEIELKRLIEAGTVEPNDDFLKAYVGHLSSSRLPLPPPRMLERLLAALVGFEAFELAVPALRLRADESKRTGLDVLQGAPHAITRTKRAEGEGKSARRVKRSYGEQEVAFEFYVEDSKTAEFSVPRSSRELLHLPLPAGGMLLLDAGFLLRRFDERGVLLASVQVPNRYGGDTAEYFRFYRGRCLEANSAASRIFVSDYDTLFVFDADLHLLHESRLDDVARERSWDDIFFGGSATPAPERKKYYARSMVVLGLAPDTRPNAETINRAYRKAIRACHPDLNPDLENAHEIAQQVNLAQEILMAAVSSEDAEGSFGGNPDDSSVVTVGGRRERVQAVCPSGDSAIVATYKGGIFEVVDGRRVLVEHVLTWVGAVHGERGRRCYSVLGSTIVSCDGRTPFEIPGRYDLVLFIRESVAFAAGKIAKVYDLTGEKRCEFVCREAIQRIEATEAGPRFITGKSCVVCDLSILGERSTATRPVIDSNVPARTTFVVPPRDEPKLSNFQRCVSAWSRDGLVPSAGEVLGTLGSESIDAPEPYGMTPLHRACLGSPGLVRVLLECGANPNVRVDSSIQSQGRYPAGYTPLHSCMNMIFTAKDEARAEGVVECLLAYGADPNATDDTGAPPLREAVNRGYLTIAEALLRQGADPNARDKRGASLLRKAIQKGNEQMEKLLREHGAS